MQGKGLSPGLPILLSFKLLVKKSYVITVILKAFMSLFLSGVRGF